MSIVNRTNDDSEKLVPLNFALGNLALSQGETGVLAYVPFPCELNKANIATMAVDGSAYLLLTASRFIAGAGVTTWALGSTFALRAFGTSGVLSSGVSLPASGSTLLKLMANDVLGYVCGAGSTLAAYGVAGCLVVNPVQDVKSYL